MVIVVNSNGTVVKKKKILKILCYALIKHHIYIDKAY